MWDQVFNIPFLTQTGGTISTQKSTRQTSTYDSVTQTTTSIFDVQMRRTADVFVILVGIIGICLSVYMYYIVKTCCLKKRRSTCFINDRPTETNAGVTRLKDTRCLDHVTFL
ncbi:hypothetical protein ACF0H5_000627 [Mactra antiquata]